MKNYFFGFSYWKHKLMIPFFNELGVENIVFINPLFKKNYFHKAIKKGLNKDSAIYIWGKKRFPLVEKFALESNIKIYRVEDGFIRSIGLGSDLTQPYSLVIDSKGIYFDPTQMSDLEHTLQTASFDKSILIRAKKITQYLIENKLSKYNLYQNKKINIKNAKKIVLVPGQVEDDASIEFGALGMTNLKLLELTRQNAKDSYIIYKPHPDVLVGNRVGHIDEEIALKYADRVVTEIGLDSVLEICDEVHTMTSLVGFEALIRKKKVFTYGMPFYSGWGLTEDFMTQERRTRKLNLNQLVAATLIIYPRYISPLTLNYCEPEELLQELEGQKTLYNSSVFYRIKIGIYNFLSRKLQLFFRIITLKL